MIEDAHIDFSYKSSHYQYEQLLSFLIKTHFNHFKFDFIESRQLLDIDIILIRDTNPS